MRLPGAPHAEQLKYSKSNVIWFASTANLSRLASHELTVNFESYAVQPLPSVQYLGEQLGDELSMVQRVSSVTRTGFLSHSSSSINSTLRRRGRCRSTGVGASHIPLRLLQFNLSRVTSGDDRTSATCAKFSCQARLQPAASRPCHTSSTATALATDTGANYF
jgi:hypothetical protein